MKKQDRKWLEHVARCSDGSGYYAGVREDNLPPKVARRLYRNGYITGIIPHNPVHKERWVITLEGRKALAQ